MKPAPHNVKRKTACTNYSQCLYQAAKEDWISFSCEDCPLFTGGEQENLKGKGEAAMSENQNSDAVKLCACGKKTISPRSDLCASCMAKRSAEKRKTNNALKEIKRGKDTIIDSPGS